MYTSASSSVTVPVRTVVLTLPSFPRQSSLRGHSSVEDASAAMELFKLVDNLWEVQLTKGANVEIVNRFEKYDRY